MRSLLLAMLFLTGCETTPYAEVFIAYRVGNDSFASCSEENSGVRLGIEKRYSDNIVGKLEYEHMSHLLCGKPFNDQPEDDVDHIGMVLRYEW